MQARQRIALFMLSITMALANAAPPEYRLVVVGPPGSSAADINEAGTIVGTYSNGTGTRAYLNRGAGLVNLGALGVGSNASAINDKGEVVGNWIDGGGQQRGFVYYHGKQRDIGTVIAGRSASFIDINNAGYITVSADVSPTGGAHGFLRAPNGRFTDIGSLPYDNPFTTIERINNRNQITGASGAIVFPSFPYRAIIWSGGVMRDLGDLGSGPNMGNAINDRGQVTGSATLPQGLRNQAAFLYSHGRMINIDGRPFVEGMSSRGTGINNLGHVVGVSNHLSGFLYRGKRMESLNALIDSGMRWNISLPMAINDAGQIAAIAERGGVQYGVRLDPIRPYLQTAPAAPPEEVDEAAIVQKSSPQADAAEARLEAEARAREVALPVQQ